MAISSHDGPFSWIGGRRSFKIQGSLVNEDGLAHIARKMDLEMPEDGKKEDLSEAGKNPHC